MISPQRQHFTPIRNTAPSTLPAAELPLLGAGPAGPLSASPQGYSAWHCRRASSQSLSSPSPPPMVDCCCPAGRSCSHAPPTRSQVHAAASRKASLLLLLEPDAAWSGEELQAMSPEEALCHLCLTGSHHHHHHQHAEPQQHSGRPASRLALRRESLQLELERDAALVAYNTSSTLHPVRQGRCCSPVHMLASSIDDLELSHHHDDCNSALSSAAPSRRGSFLAPVFCSFPTNVVVKPECEHTIRPAAAAVTTSFGHEQSEMDDEANNCLNNLNNKAEAAAHRFHRQFSADSGTGTSSSASGQLTMPPSHGSARSPTSPRGLGRRRASLPTAFDPILEDDGCASQRDSADLSNGQPAGAAGVDCDSLSTFTNDTDNDASDAVEERPASTFSDMGPAAKSARLGSPLTEAGPYFATFLAGSLATYFFMRRA